MKKRKKDQRKKKFCREDLSLTEIVKIEDERNCATKTTETEFYLRSTKRHKDKTR